MTLILKQWIARALALCVVGPLCASIANTVVASDGSHETTMLTSRSMGSGIFALASVLGILFIFGVIVGRVADRREGLLNMAFVLGWVAWTGGQLGEVFRISPEPSTLLMLSFETIVISLVVLVALILMTNPNQESHSGHRDEVSRFDLVYLIRALKSKEGVVSMGAALVGAVLIAYLFGQTPLAGQSVGVGFASGIFGGLLGALASNMVREDSNKESSTAFGPILIGILLAGVLSPMLGLVIPGSGKLLDGVLTGDLPGFLIVSPTAWAMGGLLGLPIGHSWVEHSVHQQGSRQTKTA